MRLSVLVHGHRWPQRLALSVIRVIGRGEPDPVASLSLYRPEFFGRAWLCFCESVMRGPSEWTDGERELIAAFVSRLNACPFCVGVHTGTSTLLLGSNSGVDRLADWRSAGFEPRLTAVFDLIEKTTSDPESVSAADRPRSVTATASADALYVAFLFNTINRLANAFDFQWTDDADRMRLAKGLNQMGYHVPAFLLR
jgi:uncharacterized peroxidase-related enzyme